MSKRIVVVTGAGVSASSGIPTYRAQGALWSDETYEYRSHSSHYGNYLDYLKPKWYELYQTMKNASPTPFHEFVAEQGWEVITQNVDGLHQRAGSEHVIELHGTIMDWRKLKTGSPVFSVDTLTPSLTSPEGDGRVRPDAVLFGERPRRVKEALSWVREADVVIYAGTSGNVVPVADWYKEARYSILVNKEPWGDFDEYYEGETDMWARNNPIVG